MRYYSNYRVFVLNNFERALIIYLLAAGLANFINFVIELNEKRNNKKNKKLMNSRNKISIDKFLNNPDQLKLITILALTGSIGLGLTVASKKKSRKNSSTLLNVRGGSIRSNKDHETPDTDIVRYVFDNDFPPVYDPKMDDEDYFNERVRYATLQFMLKHKFFRSLLTSIGFKTNEDSLVKLFFKFVTENDKVNNILSKYDSKVPKAIVKCLPKNKVVALLNNPFFIQNLRHILAVPDLIPIAITPAFFSLFIHQYSQYMLIAIRSHISRVLNIFQNNLLVNIDLLKLENPILISLTVIPPSILGFILNLKVLEKIKWIRALKNFSLIKNSLLGFRIFNLVIMISMASFSFYALTTPCYDYFLPLHEHFIEVVINNSHKLKTLGYEIPNWFGHRDKGIILLAPAEEVVIDNKSFYTTEEMIERTIFRGETMSLTNMCEPNRFYHKIQTLEMMDLPILPGNSFADLIKNNIKDFETITLTESEKEFLTNLKNDIIDVKAEKIPNFNKNN